MIRHILPSEVLDVDIDTPDAGSALPATTSAPQASKTTSRQRIDRTRSAGRLRCFVNVRRDLNPWLKLADAAYRSGGEPDYEPLRRADSLNRRFRRLFDLNLLNAEVSALANPLIRRGDIDGMRRLSQRIQMREVFACALEEAGHELSVCHGTRN